MTVQRGPNYYEEIRERALANLEAIQLVMERMPRGDGILLKQIKLKVGIPGVIESTAIVTAVVEGEHVVTFFTHQEPLIALTGWIERERDGSLSWRRDSYYYGE
jgi:hypothetical protein